MEKESARDQTLEQLHERRKQVVRLHLKGIKIMKIVDMTGLTYPMVRKAIDLYEAGSWKALVPASRGRAPGVGRRLSPSQEQAIQKIIIDKRPEQLKMDFFLWSTAAVAQLILRETALVMSERSTGKYLKRWGFSPQKPIKRAYEQSPKAVQSWLDEQYPAIEARAKAEAEADIVGLRYMAKAGYDPRAAPRIWERAIQNQEDFSSIFSSHPSYQQRHQVLMNHIPEAMKLYREATGHYPDGCTP